MQLTLKKTVVIVLLAAALLLGMLGWTAHVMALPFMPQHQVSVQSQMLAGGGPGINCPPYPRYC